MKFGNQGDRFRTAAVQINFGRLNIGLNMFTGDPSSSISKEDGGYLNEVWKDGSADEYRLGALSVGYGGYRAGWNNEGIRHLFQNRFAHSEHRILGRKFLHNQTYFRNLGGRGSFYSNISTFSNPYSLWSF